MKKRRTNNNSRSHQHHDYDVGYGRPPQHAQFKPGQSGNPRGRPKGRKTLRTLFETILNEKVSIREADNILTVSKLEAAIRNMVIKAMKGDAKAAKEMIALAEEYG